LINFCRPRELQNSTNGCYYLLQTRSKSKKVMMMMMMMMMMQCIHCVVKAHKVQTV